MTDLALSTRRSATELAFQTIARHSRSFALASRLLPRGARAAAAIVYTWCRRADDAVDLAASPEHAAAALARLRAELQLLYAGVPLADPVLAAFGEVVRGRGVPPSVPADLLDGMEMDVLGFRYERIDDLLLYAYRVAGAVGVMMCHVMGLADARALRNAAHLGIAMQLTNVCRDVAEDWQRGRLYLPRALLAEAGAPEDLADRAGGPLPGDAHGALADAVRRLLALADRYYRSGDAGLGALPWRSALAVRTARLVYAEIGELLARRGYDALAGRAVVPTGRKLALAGAALSHAATEWPRRARRPFVPVPLPEVPGHELLRL